MMNKKPIWMIQWWAVPPYQLSPRRIDTLHLYQESARPRWLHKEIPLSHNFTKRKNPLPWWRIFSGKTWRKESTFKERVVSALGIRSSWASVKISRVRKSNWVRSPIRMIFIVIWITSLRRKVIIDNKKERISPTSWPARANKLSSASTRLLSKSLFRRSIKTELFWMMLRIASKQINDYLYEK